MTSPEPNARTIPRRPAFQSDAEWLLQIGTPFALVAIDLDGFKNVNDQLGHAAGDECLDTIVRIFHQNLPQCGRIYRAGGDEFLCLIPGCGALEAATLAERMRVGVETAHLGPPPGVSLSIGVALSEHATTARQVLAVADEAAYCSKFTGKNRVTAWPIPEAEAAKAQFAKRETLVAQRFNRELISLKTLADTMEIAAGIGYNTVFESLKNSSSAPLASLELAAGPFLRSVGQHLEAHLAFLDRIGEAGLPSFEVLRFMSMCAHWNYLVKFVTSQAYENQEERQRWGAYHNTFTGDCEACSSSGTRLVPVGGVWREQCPACGVDAGPVSKKYGGILDEAYTNPVDAYHLFVAELLLQVSASAGNVSIWLEPLVGKASR